MALIPLTQSTYARLSGLCSFLTWIRLAIACFATVALAATGAWAKPEPTALSPFHGKVIRKLSIHVHNVFEDDDLGVFYRAVNSLKVNTRLPVIKRELLIREGSVWNDFRVRESERRLRELKYLRQVRIVPIPDGDVVDVEVHVQDTWTLIPQVSVSGGTGKSRSMVGLKETNLLGHGKRLELSYAEDESREIVSSVYEDVRLLGSRMRLQGAVFQRSDGDEYFFYLGRPAWTLVDKRSWYINTQVSDTIGRLFNRGTEDYIFRQDNEQLGVRYMLARGNPEKRLRRFWFGYDWTQDTFDQADVEDYRDLDLDPAEVSNDPSRLPFDRRYTGPVFSYNYIEPDYISLNYIDRFDRVEDYNLGHQQDIQFTLAPEALGSNENAALFSSNVSQGVRFGADSFLRGELGGATRLVTEGFTNGLIRFEAKYYNVLGELRLGDTFLGRHTLAASLTADYGSDLDRDRQLSLGGDNGLRGYKARAFNGDKRLFLNLEDRMHFADDVLRLVSFGAAAFCDIGGATYGELGRLISDDLYGDVGVGLRIAFPRSSGGQVLRVDAALPLRDGDDGSGTFELRLVFSTGQLFSSRLRTETIGPEKANVGIGFDR